MHVGRPTNSRADFALGVVVASDQADGNSRPFEPAKLPRGPDAGIHVFPLTVKEVSGDDHKRDGFVDGQLHQVFEGFASRISETFCRRAGVGFQPAQRAVDVNIGRVYKTKTVAGHPAFLML